MCHFAVARVELKTFNAVGMRGPLKGPKWRHLLAPPPVAPLLLAVVLVVWRAAVAATTPTSTSATDWSWKCENSSVGGHQKEMACLCQGEALLSVPNQLNRAVQRLTMSHTGMEVLQRKALLPYNETLADVDLVDMPKLTSIEPEAFSTLGKLRAIYIVGAPKLLSLPPGVFSELGPNFRVLRIMQTGLIMLPEMNGLGAKSALHMIDLESNKLERIPSSALRVRAEQLRLDYNAIRVVEASAFNGSEIAKLSLKGNRRLNQLSLGAFRGLKSIRELDLSSTSITRLPTEGLEELDALRVEDTPTLREVPSIYSFKHLQEAQLTYSFHCCAFRFPDRHDPEKHRAHQLHLAQICNGEGSLEGVDAKHSYQATSDTNVDGWDDKAIGFDYNWKEDAVAEVGPGGNMGVAYWDTGQDHPQRRRRRSSTDDTDHPTQFVDSFGEIMADDGFQQHHERPTVGGNDIPPVWHKAVTPPRSVHALCGNLSVGRIEVRCTPAPNALNPCEDIMGYAWLRVFVWAVVAATVAGNLAVLTVLLANIAALTVPKFLMCHLALADLCMGLYLLLLAAMDLRSSGEYFNFACAWQIEVGCNVAGFLTVFSSQLSIFTLCVITLERWFAITYAIDLNKRLRLGAAANVMAAGWVYALTMAALPLAGVSSYSSTSICLPMDTTGVAGLSYLVFLLLMAGLAFAVVLICYLQIYLSLGPETRRRTTRRRPQPLACSPTTASTVTNICKASRTELSVANKMALLVFTDFTCWAPIAFFSLTALAGHPLISVTNSKILLVFFYPLNACANPFLYAILTAQYRRDLCLLLARYGLCTRLAQRYKMAAHSSPTTNNSHQPLPLAGRGDCCMEYRSSLVSGSLIGGMPTATRTSRLLSVDQDSRDEAFV